MPVFLLEDTGMVNNWKRILYILSAETALRCFSSTADLPQIHCSK